MKLTSVSVAAAVVCSAAMRVQKPGLQLPPSAAVYQDATKKIFVESYTAYKKFAWGCDDLSPISKGCADGRNGWGASVFDAMSTLYLMGLEDWFEEAVNFTSSMDFSRSQTTDYVSVFETTIRYIGGLLSAYQLSGEKFPKLVQKAQEVADKLVYAWVGDNDIPFGYLDFTNNSPLIIPTNIAEAGSLILEWDTLSWYTGNLTYSNLALKAFRRIAKSTSPLPGLASQELDPATGDPIGGYVTWGGGSDSYFEYLIKYARLSNTKDNLYADTWSSAVDSSIRTLLKRSTVGNWTYLADYDAGNGIYEVSSHLACFHAGNWILGGRLTNNDTIVSLGLDLSDGCWNTYASTASGIGPETFAFFATDGNSTTEGLTPDQLSFYNKHGFYITSSYYILRPEVLESNFYAYRVTGDRKYLDRAASAIEVFNQYLRTSSGYVSLSDVNDPSSVIDYGESFWFAEVLKYLYLTFDDPTRVSLDEYVFNTEGHLFKAPPPKPSYGSQRGGRPNDSDFYAQSIDGLFEHQDSYSFYRKSDYVDSVRRNIPDSGC